ncbi:sin3 histone deacetylase corepressor complex component SDS3 [Orycteropus afer afer]|uniref:Sin3 histone deacetylase corepressor complex component SDS3 n=1 Tax=Orycteropus afer afer TaxID=1230840 RepID=A0A8B6ZLA3_ORYAF|nr:sin3 histone deacetylase corepressor complex component SDS3 [Orycteropus afer afer]
MSAAGLLAPAPAPTAAPAAPEYYPEEDEELESADDDERSCRGRESDEGPFVFSFVSCGVPGRCRRLGTGLPSKRRVVQIHWTSEEKPGELLANDRRPRAPVKHVFTLKLVANPVFVAVKQDCAPGRSTRVAETCGTCRSGSLVRHRGVMYQDKLASLKRQLQQLQEGTLQEYQKRMKKLDQQYKERIRNAELFLQLETEQVEKNYIKEKKAAVKEFEDKKVELKENLIAELEEKKKMIENEKLTMELTGDSMEVKPIMTRKLRRRPNDPVPIPDKRRKPAPAQLNYLLTDEQIMEDLRTLNKLKSPKRPASPSSPEHLPATPAESPAQRFEARIEDGKLYYDKRWYHKSQAIYLESKDNQKLSCVISSVGANEIWVRKTSDSTKMRIYLGQLQRGLFVIRRRRFLSYFSHHGDEKPAS